MRTLLEECSFVIKMGKEKYWVSNHDEWVDDPLKANQIDTFEDALSLSSNIEGVVSIAKITTTIVIVG
jgi:hypothetical protein